MASVPFEQIDQPLVKRAPDCVGLSNWNCALDTISPVRPSWSVSLPFERLMTGVLVQAPVCRFNGS